MPLIVAELGGFDRHAWVAAAYPASANVTYPIAGQLSKLYGRRRFLVLDLIAFVTGDALVGLNLPKNQIIAFSAFQGIGAVHGLASIAGPLPGGIVTDRFT